MCSKVKFPVWMLFQRSSNAARLFVHPGKIKFPRNQTGDVGAAFPCVIIIIIIIMVSLIGYLGFFPKFCLTFMDDWCESRLENGEAA